MTGDRGETGRSEQPHGLRRGRRSRERGAALVEFAIVFPLLFLLVAGMVDFGFTFMDVNSVRQGVREGARQAVVANVPEPSCTLVGAGGSSATQGLMCLTKERVGLSESDTRVKVAMPGGNEVGESLLVCVQHPMSSMTGVFGLALNGRTVTGKVEMRIEKVDEDLTEGQETPLEGRTWAFCA